MRSKGYDIHVTRATHWLDGETNPITLGEWLEYLEHDAEMRRDDVAVARIDDETTLVHEETGIAVWMKYSGHDRNGNMAWFAYYGGCIVVKNPDDEILGKMKQVASSFAANVIGDDGEQY